MTLTMYETLLIMPRTAGVSCNSLTELSRRRPKPRTVARCVSRVPIRLLTSWTLTVLSDMVSTLAQNIFDGLAALRRDVTRRGLLAQTVERCTNEVVRIRRTVALRHNVLNAHHVEHCAHRAAGDNTRTILGRSQENCGCAVLTVHFVLQRTVLQRHLEHVAACLFHCLLNSNRNFLRFALAHADAAIAIANHGQCGKTENPAALHHLGHAIDRDHLFTEAVVAFFSLHIRLHLCHDEFFP